MTAEFWVTQTFNGLSYGALLFHVLSRGHIVYASPPAARMANEDVKSRYLGV